jgi:hypothetical protein
MTYVPVQPECRDRDKLLLYKLAVNLAATAQTLGMNPLPVISPNMTENALLKQLVCLTYYIANNICNCSPAPPVETCKLLQEDGFSILQEDGSDILLESCSVSSSYMLTEDGYFILQEDNSRIII